jgi:hypothetical protein
MVFRGTSGFREVKIRFPQENSIIIVRNDKLQICDILIFKLRVSYIRNVIFVSKYVHLNNMLISYPCLTCIYYYPYLFVANFYSFMYKNFIRGSVKMFRVRNGSVAKLNWETTETTGRTPWSWAWPSQGFLPVLFEKVYYWTPIRQ